MFSKTILELNITDMRRELAKRGISTEGTASDLLIRLEETIREEGNNPQQFTFWCPTPSRANREPRGNLLLASTENLCEESSGGNGRCNQPPFVQLTAEPQESEPTNPQSSGNVDLTRMFAAFLQETAANRKMMEGLIKYLEQQTEKTWDPTILDYIMPRFQGHPWEDPDKVTMRWEDSLRKNHVPETCWVQVTIKYLGSDVLRAWHTQCLPDATWGQFVWFLTSRYSSPSRISALRASYHGDKQKSGEGVEGFLQEKHAMFLRLYPLEPDDTYISQVIELVNPKWRSLLRLGNCRRATHFIELARQIEQDQSSSLGNSSYQRDRNYPVFTTQSPERRYSNSPRISQTGRNDPPRRSESAGKAQADNLGTWASPKPPARATYSNYMKPSPQQPRKMDENRRGRTGPPQGPRFLHLNLITETNSPIIAFRVSDGNEYKALIDTQASSSFISEELAGHRDAIQVSVNSLPVTMGNLTAQGSTCGKVKLDIQIQNKYYEIQAHILKDSKYTLILGNDWLRQNAVVIDYESKSCSIGREERTTVNWRPEIEYSPNVNIPEAPPLRFPKPSVQVMQTESPDRTLRKVQEEQGYDPLLKEMAVWLQGEAKPRSRRKRRAWSRQSHHFTLVDGTIYYDVDRLYVPTHLRKQVLQRYHDHSLIGHPRFEETLRAVQSRAYWPGMTEEVRCYVRSCQTCLRNKPLTDRTRTPDSPRTTYNTCGVGAAKTPRTTLVSPEKNTNLGRPKYQVGTKVLVKNIPLSDKLRGIHAGFAPKWKGPHTIQRTLGGNVYLVQMDGNRMVKFAANDIRPWITREDTQGNWKDEPPAHR